MLFDCSQCGPVAKPLECQLGIHPASYLDAHMPVDTFLLPWAAGEILREIYLTEKMASACS